MMLIIWIPPLECVALSCPLTGGNRIILPRSTPPVMSLTRSLAFYQKLVDPRWRFFYIYRSHQKYFPPRERDDSRSECKLDLFLLPDAAIHRWEINRVQKINGAAPWMHFFLCGSNLLLHKDAMGIYFIYDYLHPPFSLAYTVGWKCCSFSKTHTELYGHSRYRMKQTRSAPKSRREKCASNLYPRPGVGNFSPTLKESGLSAFPLFVFMFMRVIRVADKSQKNQRQTQLARSIFRKHKEKLGQLNPLCVNNWLSI